MAQSVVIRENVYSNLPAIQSPKADGSGMATFWDTTGANISASDIRSGKKGYGPSGEVTGNLEDVSQVTATISTKSQVVNIPSGIHPAGGTVQIAAAAVSDCTGSNILYGKTILGQSGTLKVPVISQDPTSHILTIE